MLGRAFGLAGITADVQRALVVAYATSVAVIMGVNLIYPVLPPMMQQLGVDESAIGLVMTVYSAPTILLSPVAGILADLYGRKLLLFWGLLLFGTAGAGVGLASTLEWVLAMRFVQGVGASALFPLTIVLLSDLLDGEQETSAQGLKVVTDRLATAALPVLAGVLAAVAWNSAYYLFALSIPIAFLSLRWTPEHRGDSTGGVRQYLGALRGVAGRPPLVVAFAAGFLRFFLDYGYFTYLPIFLVLTRGTSPVVVGGLLACFAMGAMVTASQSGRLSRGRNPAHLVCVGFALDGLSVLAIPFLPSEVLVGVSLFVYGLGNGMISPQQKSLLTRNAPAGTLGGVIALDRLVQQIAKTVSPGLMGMLLLVSDISAVFWLLGALSVASLPLAALLLRAQTSSQPALLDPALAEPPPA